MLLAAASAPVFAGGDGEAPDVPQEALTGMLQAFVDQVNQDTADLERFDDEFLRRLAAIERRLSELERQQEASREMDNSILDRLAPLEEISRRIRLWFDPVSPDEPDD